LISAFYSQSNNKHEFSGLKKKGNHPVKVTVRFGNPFLMTIYTASMLAIGWAIGSHWGSTLTSAWMLFFATIFLFLHDACVAVLSAIAATKVASSGKDQESGFTRTAAETPAYRRQKQQGVSIDSKMPSESGERQDHQRWHQYLDLDIEEMEFSVRTYGLLKDTDIQTVRALVQFSEQDLIHAGFTSGMIREINDTLDAVGIHLGMRFEDSQNDQKEDSQS
jgi:hypothetical protein